MVSVLKSRVRTPKWERERLRGIKRRDRIKEEDYREYKDSFSRSCLWALSGGCSEESSEEERVESDSEESSEEESIA